MPENIQSISWKANLSPGQLKKTMPKIMAFLSSHPPTEWVVTSETTEKDGRITYKYVAQRIIPA